MTTKEQAGRLALEIASRQWPFRETSVKKLASVILSDGVLEALLEVADGAKDFVKRDGHDMDCSYNINGNTPDTDYCSCGKKMDKALTSLCNKMKQI